MRDLEWLAKAIITVGMRPHGVYIPPLRLLVTKHWQVRLRWNWVTFFILRREANEDTNPG